MECNYSNICFNRFEALRRILKNLTQKKEDWVWAWHSCSGRQCSQIRKCSFFFRILHPVKMVCGFAAISAAFGIFVYCTNSQWTARRFKRNHPVISLIIIVAAGYLLVYMFGAVIVFMFGIAFPLLRKC